MHQIVQRLELRPRPYWGAHSSPQTPYLVKGREGGEEKGREGREQEGEGREARGGCLLLNLSLAIRPWFACNVIVRGAGLC